MLFSTGKHCIYLLTKAYEIHLASLSVPFHSLSGPCGQPLLPPATAFSVCRGHSEVLSFIFCERSILYKRHQKQWESILCVSTTALMVCGF